MKWVYNIFDNKFNIGDAVWITNSLMSRESCYAGEVIQVVPDSISRLGEHYVIYIATNVDDYLTIREAERCFKSPKQYKELCK